MMLLGERCARQDVGIPATVPGGGFSHQGEGRWVMCQEWATTIEDRGQRASAAAFMLGLLWLAGASAWMLPPPCMNLLAGSRLGPGLELSRHGAMKQLASSRRAPSRACPRSAGAPVLPALRWLQEILLAAGVWLIYFEAPINLACSMRTTRGSKQRETLPVWGLERGFIARAQDMLWQSGIQFARTVAWTWDNPELRVCVFITSRPSLPLFLLVLLLPLLAAGCLWFGTV